MSVPPLVMMIPKAQIILDGTNMITSFIDLSSLVEPSYSFEIFTAITSLYIYAGHRSSVAIHIIM